MNLRLNQLRAVLRQAICTSSYYVNGSRGTEIETQFLCDDENGRYMLLNIGWQGKTRIFNPVLYVCLRNDKIWIEEDWTENGITENLLQAGVQHDEIVLAFQHPNMRPLTDFAAA